MPMLGRLSVEVFAPKAFYPFKPTAVPLKRHYRVAAAALSGHWRFKFRVGRDSVGSEALMPCDIKRVFEQHRYFILQVKGCTLWLAVSLIK